MSDAAPDDATLLRRYADTRSEEAFGEFVRRNLVFVYTTALRRVGGDAHRAEEIAQLVFTRVAQKASALSRHPALNAWLHTATRYAAADLVRSEQRRRARELAAHALAPDMHAPTPQSSHADWEKLRPEIDVALDQLRDTDRSAILLRFFENRSYSVIGEKLKLSEDSARKRTDRALEKLRLLLARRGLTSTVAALGIALAQNASASALPSASLAATITTASISASTPAALSGLTAILAMTKLQTGTVVTLALAATLGSVFLAAVSTRQAASLAVPALSTTPAFTQARDLSDLHGKIAAVRTALTDARAQHQKIAAEKARQSRQDEINLRGPAALFEDRLSAEASLIEFIKEHPLDPVTRENLKNILVEERIAQREHTLKAFREGDKIVFADKSIHRDAQQRIRDLLGDQLYEKYDEISVGRPASKDFEADLADAGVPLSEVQSRAVAHHYYQGIIKAGAPSKTVLPSGLTSSQETFLANIAPHLSPQQTASVRNNLQQMTRISAGEPTATSFVVPSTPETNAAFRTIEEAKTTAESSSTQLR